MDLELITNNGWCAIKPHPTKPTKSPELADQQRLIFFNSVQTLDAIWRIYQERWMIEKDNKKKSSDFVLSEWLDDDEGDQRRQTKLKTTLRQLEIDLASHPAHGVVVVVAVQIAVVLLLIVVVIVML